MNLSLNLLKKKQKTLKLNINKLRFNKNLEIHDLSFIKKSNSFKFLKKSNVTNKWISWIHKLNLEPTLSNANKLFDNKIKDQSLKINPMYKSGYSKIHELKLISINIASPNKIKEWAEKVLPNGKIFGEVTNANTLHYKTFRPHKGGLFCERIFGPLKDFECACGIRSKPTELESKKILEHEQTIRNFCPNCDVEYTWSVIRRYQLGYIQLVSPVSHIWFLKANPSYLSLLLDLRRSHLESIIYCTESITLENLWKSSQNLGLDTSPSILYSIWQKLLEVDKVNLNQSFKEEKLIKKKKLKIKKFMLHSNFSFILKKKEKELKKRLYFMFLYKKDSPYYENFPKLNLNMSKISMITKFHLKKQNSIRNSLYIYKELDLFLKNKIEFNKKSKKILTIYSKMLKLIYKKSFIQALFISKKSFPFSLKIAFFKNLLEKENSYVSKIFHLKSNPKFTEVDKVHLNQRFKEQKFKISTNELNEYKKSLKIKSVEQIKNIYEKKIFDFKEEFLEFSECFLQIYFFKFFLPNRNQFENNFYNEFDKKIPNIVENLYNKTFKFIPSEENSFKTILFEFLTFYLINKKLNASNKKNSFKILPSVLKTKGFFNSNIQLQTKEETEFFNLKEQNKNSKKIIKISSKIRKQINNRQKLFYYSGFSIEKKVLKLELFLEKPKKNKFLKYLYKKYNNNKIQDKNFGNSYKNVELIRQIKSKIDSLLPQKNKNFFYQFLYFIYDCLIQKKDLFLLKKFYNKVDFFEELFFKNINSLILTSNQNDIYSLKISYFLKFYMENHRYKFSDMLNFINFIYYLKFPFSIKNHLNKSKITLVNRLNLNNEIVLKEKPMILTAEFQNLNVKEKKTSILSKKKIFNQMDFLNKRKKILFLQKQKNLSFRKPLYAYSMDFKKLKKQKEFDSLHKQPNSSFFTKKKKNMSIRNDLYTISYSHLWSFTADWKSFFYYNSAPKDFEDIPIYSYNKDNQDKFFEKESLTRTTELLLTMKYPLAGASMIKKLLSEYDSFELKKMVKQHQVLLPKLNSYIRILKEKAIKKFDFVKIQKLLNKRDHIIKRLKLIRKFSRKDVDPTSMILSVLPVLPPDLRPILKLENQIAASDLNRLYQRIIFRNERLKKFLKDPSTSQSFEMKYAQRLLQESVDNLIQNGKGSVKPETNSRGQALKSLSEILKGKQGRFRQYLLGKRVDYSGRSVIVVGPKLKLYECGLPKEMAIELFLPFLIKRILHYKIARTVIGAKNFLYSNKTYCINLLYEIMKNHPILLNRAPTLHRLGIQAFRPKLVEGRAILLHPLVCPAFNADFDGDQMAVHVPITVEARAEAWTLLFSRNHLISPATGEPIILPSQDMVLGCYYLTSEKNIMNQRKKFLKSKINFTSTPIHSIQSFSPCFINFERILNAYQLGNISLQSIVWLKWNGKIQFVNESISLIEIRLINNGNRDIIQSKSYKSLDKTGKIRNKYIRTTPGRILINSMTQKCINL